MELLVWLHGWRVLDQQLLLQLDVRTCIEREYISKPVKYTNKHQPLTHLQAPMKFLSGFMAGESLGPAPSVEDLH